MTPDTRPLSGAGTRFLVVAASFVVVVAGLRAAAALVLPFLVAVFLAVVSVPFMAWMQRRKVPQSLAVLTTMLATVAAVSLLGYVLARSINEFTAAAPRYQYRLQLLIDNAFALAGRLGVPTEEWQSLDLIPANLFDILGSALGTLASFASNTFLVMLTMVFILMEAAGFSAKLRVAFGEQVQLDHFARMTQEVQRYLFIKSALSAATGVAVWLLTAAVGLDFALLWGLVAFLLNFIPNLGSIIAAVPAVLLAIVQLGPGPTAIIAVGYLVINTIFGNFIEPLWMGRRLGMSPLIVFVSLVFWGWVWGAVGMLFSVPLTMVVKIALENTDEFRWVAMLLDPNPVAAQQATAQSD